MSGEAYDRVVEVLHLVLDHTHGEAEGVVDRAHPLGVAARQVVVDRDHVRAEPGQRVQVGGQCRHQRLALAGRHLRDLALVQHHAAHELHVEVAHADGPPRRLTARGERLGEKRLEVVRVGQPLSQLVGLAAQLDVRQRLHRGLERIDRLDHGTHPLDVALVLGAEDRPEDRRQHGVRSYLSTRLAPVRS